MKTQVDFVESIADRELVIQCLSQEREALLVQLGGKRKTLRRRTWIIPYEAEEDIVTLLCKLRDLGFAMLGGSSGWPPAAVFESLREKGKINGGFKEIVWKGAGKLAVVER